MANNELLVDKCAVFESVAIGNVAATHKSGVMIPAGAIITKVRFMAPSALTNTDAAATVQLHVGTFAICDAVSVSLIGEQTVPTINALLTTTGVYVPTTGELILEVEASNASSCNATYDIYVDYLYVV